MRLLVTLVCLLSASAAVAQPRYDADCRPLPAPGYMMAPQPPSPACLEQRAAAARAAEAERRRQQERAAAAEKARQERLAAEQANCATVTTDELRAALTQDPTILGQTTRILDMTDPHFDKESCRNEIMTTKGIVDTVIRFQEFNGKRFLRIRATPRPGG